MNSLNRAGLIASGLAAGAAYLYLADPERGAERRAFVRDQAFKALCHSQDFLSAAGRDLRERAQGLASQVRQRFDRDDLSDESLASRVRTKIASHLTHPGALEVTANQGRIALSGPILFDELPHVLKAVYSVPGVLGVDDWMEAHEDADTVELVPAPSQWTPGVQLLTGAAVGVAVLLGSALLRRRGAGIPEDEMELFDTNGHSEVSDVVRNSPILAR